MLQPILKYAHQLLTESVEPGELVVDATCGNGHDTLFLSQLVKENGKVLGFDIQHEAIKKTEALLKQHQRTNVTLIHDGHENIATYLAEDEEISAAIFNLGYLPGSDKTIITEGNSTIRASEHILKHLKKHGLVVLVVYHGHAGGQEEKAQLLSYVKELDQKDYHVLRYEFINQLNNPPFIIAIEKK